MSQVKTAGEAISVLVQVAELAQAKGILSLEDAVVTKSAIDFLRDLASNSEPVEGEVEHGPH
jgi:hypothetical protein